MAATPPLAAALGLRGAMIVFCAVGAAVAALFVAVVRESADGEAPASAPAATAPAAGALRRLLENRDLVLVFSLCFLGLGFFNGLTTWLEPILARSGIGAVEAGTVGGLLIIGGIGGAAVIPALSDRFRRRKPFLVLCAVGALLTLHPLCTVRSYPLLLVLAGALGFLFLPAYALLLEMSAELAGPALAGSATGILMLTGNAGGVAVIILMPVIKGGGASWMPAVWLMLGLLGVALLLSLIVAETFHLAVRR